MHKNRALNNLARKKLYLCSIDFNRFLQNNNCGRKDFKQGPILITFLEAKQFSTFGNKLGHLNNLNVFLLAFFWSYLTKMEYSLPSKGLQGI